MATRLYKAYSKQETLYYNKTWGKTVIGGVIKTERYKKSHDNPVQRSNQIRTFNSGLPELENVFFSTVCWEL